MNNNINKSLKRINVVSLKGKKDVDLLNMPKKSLALKRLFSCGFSNVIRN